MTQQNKLRIGVIGVGFGTTVHIPAFQDEGLEIIGVCSSRPERVRSAAQQFGIPKQFTDYRELLTLEEIDAVSIVTPPALHYEMTMAALKAGKHVICEKPFALNQAQAKDMMETAQAQGVTAMIAHEFRFASARQLVKDLVSNGYIGQLRMAHLSLFTNRILTAQSTSAPPQVIPPSVTSVSKGGGFLNALGSHYIDCLRDWFGDISAVSGKLYSYTTDKTRPETETSSEADNAFDFRLSFKNGGWAAMTGTSAAPFGSGANIELYGAEGTLVTLQPGVNPPSNGGVKGARLGEEGLHNLVMPERLIPPEDSRDDRLPPFKLLVREFIKGIETGCSPSPNFSDGYRCQQVLDAIIQSHQSGHWVNVSVE